MKLHPEDPRLTAYLLGELTAEESAMVERAAASDPALRIALRDTERVQSQLLEIFARDAEGLLPRQRENIRKAARQASKAGKIERLVSHRQTRKFWVPVAAAAVIVAGVFVLKLIPASDPGTTLGSANRDAPAATAAVDEGIPVPVPPREAAGNSLSRISHAVRLEKRMPEKSEVRLDEILNAFPLKPSGITALWEGCSLSAEVLPCPWQPSSTLVVVAVRASQNGDRSFLLTYDADGQDVSDHRLLGGSQELEGLAAGTGKILVFEIRAQGSQLGRFQWKVDGNDAPPLRLAMDLSQEPSDDARFAALACGFSLWLAGEGEGMIDDSLVLGLAREVAARVSDPARLDFLALVDETVKLANR